MNRRDTVIIAAVLNCALLGALFITAKRSEDKSLEIPASAFRAPIVEVSSDPGESSTGGVKGELVRQFMEEPIVITKSPESSSEAQKTSSVIQVQEGQGKAASQTSGATAPVVSISKELTKNPDLGVAKKEAASVQEQAEQLITIVVKKGDFLERIAKANGTTVNTIMKLNNLTSTQLKIGQLLKVPELKEERKINSVTVASSDDYYTVREGDSAWSVALRHKMKVTDLLKLNDLDEHSARRIKPGDQLRIR
ncbi:lytic transglycosylase [Chlamydiifrater phoenicopteri]|uniref:lytic transglycosylase n=1 Tax=Chlamydiifrater phoenicopteri TaxID=2681469 RepID=UPI001BCDABAE|nr:LysM peptidoglycan-binding domain-containing protein [Chlamydiifrater phoenicopteri]